MKGFMQEFEEQMSEKDSIIKELKEELKRKDEENKLALAEVFEEKLKTDEKLIETQKAIAELMELFVGLNGGDGSDA